MPVKTRPIIGSRSPGRTKREGSTLLVLALVVLANVCVSLFNCVAERATSNPMWGFDAALAFQGTRSSILFGTVILVTLPYKRTVLPRPEHQAAVLRLGVSFSVIPIGYIMGLQRAGPLIASIYEGPLVPVATFGVVLFSGTKIMPRNLAAWLREILPLLMACFGSLIVILYKPDGHPHHSRHALHPAGHRRGLPNEHPDGGLSIDGGLHVLQPSGYLLGNVLLTCVSIGHALYYAINSKLVAHYPAPMLAAWTGGCAAVMYFSLLIVRAVIGLHSGAGTSLEFIRDHLFVDRDLWSTMLLGVVLIQFGSFIIMPWASRRLSPLTVAMSNLIGPGLTAGLSHFWFSQDIHPMQIIGIVVTVIALAFYVRLNKRQPQ